MRIAVGSDGKSHLTDFIVRELGQLGHEVGLFGALKSDSPSLWPTVAAEVASAVAARKFDQAVLLCWTGTGITIAANKIAGIRAALCQDAETARGARRWNDANILTLSMRSISEPIAKEILQAWLSTAASTDAEDQTCFDLLRNLESR